ncbi:hypothetical protein Tco_0411859 [Tanacetum coccineum]
MHVRLGSGGRGGSTAGSDYRATGSRPQEAGGDYRHAAGKSQEAKAVHRVCTAEDAPEEAGHSSSRSVMASYFVQPTKKCTKRRTRRLNPETTLATTAATTTTVTNAQLQVMIDQGVTTVLAACDANTNGVDIYSLGTGDRRNEPATQNKRKQDNNQQPQQQYQNKRQNTGGAYAVGIVEKKQYGGSKPLCSKCNYYHDGLYAPKCHKCNKVGHSSRDFQGHFKRECPKLKNNNNRGNQVGGGNAPAKVYAVGHARTNPDSNVVTDLMPVELGSFDAIIVMDWMVKYHAIIVYAEKIIRIPWGNETLIVHGDGSNRGHEARLHIISYTKKQEYMLKGCPVFLVNVNTKETEDKNKPPTKNQLRNQMMTYLKHVGNFKHAELKIKKFEEVQALYEKIKRSDEDFISIGSAEDERLIKKMNEKGVDSSKDEMIKEESKEEVQEESKEEESKKKRKLGTRKKMKSRKRRYIQNTSEDDSDKENDELRLHLTIAPDEEKEVDYEILDRKYPIKEWKTECLGTKPQTDQAEHLEEINLNVVIRSNGQKRYFSTLMSVLSIFDREDLNAVYQLVMDRFQDEIPEGFDRVLWGDLMVMFNPDDENEFWNAPQDGRLHKNWLVHKQTACGKDFSNPFMVDNLPKIVRFSTHLASVVKSWLVHDQTVHALASPKANELTIPEQTATGKGTSNPLMAGSLPKTTKPT